MDVTLCNHYLVENVNFSTQLPCHLSRKNPDLSWPCLTFSTSNRGWVGLNPVPKLGTWSYIVRYLIHHILSHFPPKIREFGFIIDQMTKYWRIKELCSTRRKNMKKSLSSVCQVQRLLELRMDPNETCEPHGSSAVHQAGTYADVPKCNDHLTIAKPRRLQWRCWIPVS